MRRIRKALSRKRECYPNKVPALHTMTKKKFNSLFLVLLLVSRQTKSQLLMINKLVPIKYGILSWQFLLKILEPVVVAKLQCQGYVWLEPGPAKG